LDPIMSPTRLAIASMLFAGVIFGPALKAQALTVTHTVSNLAGNFSQDTSYADRTYAISDVGTVVSAGGPVADAVGANLTFTTRYMALLVADKDANGTATTTTGISTAAYRVQFNVTAAAGVVYTLAVDTRILGELTHNNDETGTASSSIANATGTYAGPSGNAPTGTLSLTNIAANTATNGTDVAFSDSNTFTITGIVGTGAPQVFTLDFTWTMLASSITTGNDQGDESAVRLGLPAATTLTGTTAGDYAGSPSRLSTCTSTFPAFGGCDGHLVTVKVTETQAAPAVGVPLPAPLLLVGIGLAGLLGKKTWRRRGRR
jgi:hypothetical protein